MRSPAAGFGLALLCTFVSLIHISTATASDLFDFRSDSGRFRIGFPGTTPASRRLLGVKFPATTNNVLHEVTVDGTEFAVELHDIPRAATMLLSRDFILERATAGVLADLGARELASRAVSRQQYPARRVHYEVPEQGLVGEMLLVLAETPALPRECPPPDTRRTGCVSLGVSRQLRVLAGIVLLLTQSSIRSPAHSVSPPTSGPRRRRRSASMLSIAGPAWACFSSFSLG